MSRRSPIGPLCIPEMTTAKVAVTSQGHIIPVPPLITFSCTRETRIDLFGRDIFV